MRLCDVGMCMTAYMCAYFCCIYGDSIKYYNNKKKKANANAIKTMKRALL